MTNAAERQRAALRRMAAEDPELAARLILMTLPASPVPYELELDGMGTHRAGSGEPEFRMTTDPRTLAELATGSSRPLGLMLRGRMRIRGKRRKALKLRKAGQPSLADVVEAGGKLDPDVLYRSLPYLIDPEWTKGHNFTVRYVVGSRFLVRQCPRR